MTQRWCTALDSAREAGHTAVVEYLENVINKHVLCIIIFNSLLFQPLFRNYVTAVSCAVRGGQLNLAVGPFLLSYLRCGFGMREREVRLVQGVICRTYFDQFQEGKITVDDGLNNSHSDYMKK